MILKQFYLGCLAHASYLIIDEGSKAAAVIDPQRDIEQYLEEAERYGAKIQYVILTHFHADFIAGHLELKRRTGATICLGARGQAEYEMRALHDGDVLELGELRLGILETPGHTPEGISIVLTDPSESKAPKAVFTGDTLFVGDVGRPDLLASFGVTADELANWLYDSLHEKLMKLPDETLVYPAHGAGSMCGKNLGKEAFSTIGEQRRFNYALQPMSRERFIEVVTAEQPEAPSYFAFDAVMNRKDRESLDTVLEKTLKPLSLDRVVELRDAGAQVMDVREAADFAGAHLRGSLNIGLDGKFATWAGTVLDREHDIVIVGDPGTEREAAMRLGRIGLDRVAGFLEHGPAALDARPDLLARTERITARALAQRMGGTKAPQIVDVRTEREWRDGHVEGSLNIPLNELERRMDEVPADESTVILCRTGYRSSLAASMIERSGRPVPRDLVGGIEGWRASDLPVVVPTA